MRYEETNHKLQKTWNLAQQQENQINNLSDEVNISQDKTKILVEGYINNKFVYESEWTEMEELKDGEGNGTGYYMITYAISFIEIPVSFLPFIKYQILYDTNMNSSKISNNSVFYLLKEEYEGEGLENIIAKVDMMIYFEMIGDKEQQVSSKIYLNIANPDVSS
jgi:hypothetical protein